MIDSRALTGAVVSAILVLSATVSGQSLPELRLRATPDALEVSGASSSDAHSGLLKSAIARYGGGRSANFELVIDQATPSSWAVVTELALRAGALLEEGDVRVSVDEVVITGTTTAMGELESLLGRIDAVRLPEMHVDSRVIEVSSERIPFGTLCRRQFLSFARNNSVRYIGTGERLRSGARGALDRLVELMHDCPDLKVGISGRSRAAADAVANHLLDAGIDAVRLKPAVQSVNQESTTAADQRAAGRDVIFELLAP